MKIGKNYLIDRIQYYFLFLFPFSIILFNPSKEFLGFLSITDIFVSFSMGIFLFYLGLEKVKITNRFILLIVLFLFSFLSLIVNERLEFLDTIRYQLRWVLYISVFFIIYNYVNLKSLLYFKRGLFIATFFVCVYAILQSLFKEAMIPTIFWVHNLPDYIVITFRAVGTFDNPLNLCGFLVFPLGLLQFTRIKTKKERTLNILIYLTLVFTVSKIGFIVVLVSLLIYLKKYIKFLVYGSFAIFIAIIVYINIPQSNFYNSYLYQRINSQKVIDQSVDTRLHMLESSFEIIKENPIFGIGYENFEENYLNLNKKEEDLKLSSSSFTSENFLLDFYLDNGFIPFLILVLLFLETILIFYTTKNALVKQFAFSILLFIIVGLVMSARTVPMMYLLFTYLAIIFKIQKHEQSIDSNNSELLL